MMIFDILILSGFRFEMIREIKNRDKILQNIDLSGPVDTLR
jgi:hypothetical protein